MPKILPSLNSNYRPFASFARGETGLVRRGRIVGRRIRRGVKNKGIPAARRLGSGLGKTSLSTLRWARDNPVKAVVIGGMGLRVARNGMANIRYAQARRKYESNMPASKQTVDASARRL